MNHRRGLTVLELLVVVAVLAAAVAFAVHALIGHREEARRLRCQSNLIRLAQGMERYLGDHEGRFYTWPAGRAGCGTTESANAADFGGAEWLASLYWTPLLSEITDPSVFLCPGSGDSNDDGRNLGRLGCSGPGFQPGPDGKLRPEAVSYAGMGATSIAVYERAKLGRSPKSKSAIRDDFPPNEQMACDDTEGPINHGTKTNGGMNVLFFDAHVEYWTQVWVDLEHGVGQGGLVVLRN